MKCPFVIKKCSCCKKLLVAYYGNFSKDKRGKYGVHSKCKICKNNYDRKRNGTDENKPMRKRGKKKTKEEHKEYCRNYHHEHKEEINKRQKKYREEHKEKLSQQQKEWRENNPEKSINYIAKRRQLEEIQGKGITKEQWCEMMEFFDWKCAYSGEQLNKNNRTIDHIVPLSKNGEHEIWNCVPMYANYNFSKQTKDMEEWYIQQEFYSEERLIKIYSWCEYAYEKWKEET